MAKQNHQNRSKRNIIHSAFSRRRAQVKRLFFALGFVFCCLLYPIFNFNLHIHSSSFISKNGLKKLDDPLNNEVVKQQERHEPFMVAWKEYLLLVDLMKTKSAVATVVHQTDRAFVAKEIK